MQNLCCENEYKIERLRFTFTANVRFKLRTEFLRIENKQIKQSRTIVTDKTGIKLLILV